MGATRDTYFEIESKLHGFCQGDTSVTVYFTTLIRFWQQLDLFEVHEWKCPDDALRYKSIVEKRRVFKFLFGLNHNLDEVRGRILGTSPCPASGQHFPSYAKKRADGKSCLVQPLPTHKSTVRHWSLTINHSLHRMLVHDTILIGHLNSCLRILEGHVKADYGVKNAKSQTIPWTLVGRSMGSWQIGSLSVKTC